MRAFQKRGKEKGTFVRYGLDAKRVMASLISPQGHP